jgi:uncharacterized membrane protein
MKNLIRFFLPWATISKKKKKIEKEKVSKHMIDANA